MAQIRVEHNGWRVEGTPVLVRRDRQAGWEVRVVAPALEQSQLWLSWWRRNGLDETLFASRADSVRYVRAALAADPMPEHDPGLADIVRDTGTAGRWVTADGRYEIFHCEARLYWCNCTVTLKDWYAPTLRACRALIAQHHREMAGRPASCTTF